MSLIKIATYNTHSFKISASDKVNNVQGVGVQTVKYQFKQTSAAILNGDSNWLDGNVKANDGSKYVVMNLVSGTDNSSLGTDELCEGTWYLHVRGIDKANNVSNDIVREFKVDKNLPVTTITTTKDNDNTSYSLQDPQNDPWYFNADTLTIGGQVSDTNGLATEGTVVIKKTVGGSAATPIATLDIVDAIPDSGKNYVLSNGTWSYELTAAASNANIINNETTLISVIVKDIAGKESQTYKFNVFRDTAGPVINITSIVNGDAFAQNSMEAVGGTIIDAGSGVETATYKLERITSMTSTVENGATVYTYVTDTEHPVVPTKTANADNSFTLGGSKATISNLSFGSTEGALLLTVTAVDKAGNSGEQKVHFSYDLAKPDFNESKKTINDVEIGVGASGLTTNTTVTFSGTGKDSNEFKRIEFTDTTVSDGVIPDKTKTYTGKTNNSQVEWTQTFNVGSGGREVQLSEKPDSWPTGYYTNPACTTAAPDTFNAGNYYMKNLTDGEHIFKIVAYDSAGKSTEIQRTVIVDTVAPVIASNKYTIDLTKTPIGTGDNAKDWYKSANIPVIVEVSDNTNGTGISKVEYSTNYAPNSSEVVWNTLALTSGKYKGYVSCANGSNTITVRATDVAGNVSNVLSKTIYVDTDAPTTPNLVDEVSVILTNGTKIENGRLGVEVNGENPDKYYYDVVLTASDTLPNGITNPVEGNDYTGIAAVTFTMIGSTPLENGIPGTYDQENDRWTITIPAEVVDSSGSATFEIKDKVGNSVKSSLFQLQRDNTYPTVKMNVIHDADLDTGNITEINKTLTISGTASDNQGLVSVKLQYYKGATAPTDSSNWTDYPNATSAGEDASVWSFEVDTELKKNNELIFLDNSTVYFRVIATDKAGNVGNGGSSAYGNIYGTGNNAAHYAEVKISQDSDRPVITFNNVILNGMSSTNYLMKKDKSIIGTVNDDDGTVQEVRYLLGRNSRNEEVWSKNIYSNGLINISELGYRGNGSSDLLGDFESQDDKDSITSANTIGNDGENNFQDKRCKEWRVHFKYSKYK